MLKTSSKTIVNIKSAALTENGEESQDITPLYLNAVFETSECHKILRIRVNIIGTHPIKCIIVVRTTVNSDPLASNDLNVSQIY